MLDSINLDSKIVALISDDRTLYVSLRNGKLLYFPVDGITKRKMSILRKRDPASPLSVLKLSRDKSFLIGYVDEDNKEEFFVFNTTKKDMKPWSAKLDLAPGAAREDPEKLLVISDDCLNVFARGENNKGIIMYSLFDGSEVVNSTAMHTNYIFQVLVTRDSKTVITCGKDKKIKVWDWIKQSLTYTLLLHEEAVESIAMSADQRILFSAGLDYKVGIWNLNSGYLLGTLTTKFPIRSLYLSDDNDFLIAASKASSSEPA